MTPKKKDKTVYVTAREDNHRHCKKCGKKISEEDKVSMGCGQAIHHVASCNKCTRLISMKEYRRGYRAGYYLRTKKAHDLKKWEEQIRMKVDDYLFDTNLRWATIHTRIVNLLFITPMQKDEYEEAVAKLTKLISTLLIEEHGRCWQDGCDWGYERAKKELRKKIMKEALSPMTADGVNFANAYNQALDDILKLL